MANVVGYIVYNLLWLKKEGLQPYEAVASAGMELDGGIVSKKRWYFGYLRGNAADVNETVDVCKAWNMKKVTQVQAITKITDAFSAELTEPITVNADGSLRLIFGYQ